MSDLHDKKSDFKNRNILAFFLFVFIGLFSVGVCAKAVVFNPTQIEASAGYFSSVDSFRQDVLEYTQDIFLKNGLNADRLDTVITQSEAQNTVDAFAAVTLEPSSSAGTAALDDSIKTMTSDIKEELNAQLEYTDYSPTEAQKDALINEIDSFVRNELAPPENNIESVMNIGSLVSVIVMVVGALFTLVFGAMLLFTGKRRYRSVRSIAESFTAAGITELIAALAAVIIFKVKSVDIYPNYIKIAFDSWVNASIESAAICGGCMLLISVIFATISWKLKRKK